MEKVSRLELYTSIKRDFFSLSGETVLIRYQSAYIKKRFGGRDWYGN